MTFIYLISFHIYYKIKYPLELICSTPNLLSSLWYPNLTLQFFTNQKSNKPKFQLIPCFISIQQNTTILDNRRIFQSTNNLIHFAQGNISEMQAAYCQCSKLVELSGV